MTTSGDDAGPASDHSIAEPQMTREAYLAERADKIALMEKQGEFLDKSLLTLAGGALGLTLTFLHDHDAGNVGAYSAIAGMGLLVTSLLSVLFSLNFSQRSISLHIDALDEWCRADFSAGHPSECFVQQNPIAAVTLWANRLATASLVAGVIFVSAFVAINLLKPSGDTTTMSNNDKSKTNPSTLQPLTKGAVIKPPPVQQPTQTTNQGNKK